VLLLQNLAVRCPPAHTTDKTAAGRCGICSCCRKKCLQSAQSKSAKPKIISSHKPQNRPRLKARLSLSLKLYVLPRDSWRLRRLLRAPNPSYTLRVLPALFLDLGDCSPRFSQSPCTYRPMLRLDNGRRQGRGRREIARLPPIFLTAYRIRIQ
jgi:hypothetical protein